MPSPLNAMVVAVSEPNPNTLAAAQRGKHSYLNDLTRNEIMDIEQHYGGWLEWKGYELWYLKPNAVTNSEMSAMNGHQSLWHPQNRSTVLSGWKQQIKRRYAAQSAIVRLITNKRSQIISAQQTAQQQLSLKRELIRC